MTDHVAEMRRYAGEALEALGRPINLMEVCGTHTVAIFRGGIHSAFPAGLRMLSGPGCPVCVTDQGYIDTALELAARSDCIIATYGDMIRVPGGRGSLETLRGARVEVVLSSDDAVGLARENPDKVVVFLAVGFETTTPATAVAVETARRMGVENFCVLCGHKLVVPAMRALLSAKNDQIDGFLCPGHVSVIIGSDAYGEIARDFRRPCVVAGFESAQILDGIGELCRQLSRREAAVGSLYRGVVTPGGNKAAQAMMRAYFEPYDGPWRGLGVIPGGSLRLRAEYARYDARRRFGLEERVVEEPAGCRCGQVLCGLMSPPDCGLFGRACTPDAPVGPCMVSSEGACSAWYKYGGRSGRHE